jgi:hypothetical protein
MNQINPEQFRMIGLSINQQINNLRTESLEANVALFRNDNFKISFYGENYSLRLVNFQVENLVELPVWIQSEIATDSVFSFPENRVAEMAFLIRKTFEMYYEDDTFGVNDSFIQVLKKQSIIWKRNGELLSTDEQRGLIGEILSVVEILNIFDNQLIVDCWDETSRNRIDIDIENKLQIEIKSTGLDSNEVTSSSGTQFIVGEVPFLLCVAEVIRTEDGQLLPELINSVIENISCQNRSLMIRKLRSKIESRYPSLNRNDYFSSKWEVGSVRLHEVTKESLPHLFAQSIPEGISVNSFKFNPNDLTLIESEQMLGFISRLN